MGTFQSSGWWQSCLQSVPCTSQYSQKVEFDSRVEELKDGIVVERKKFLLGIERGKETVRVRLNEAADALVWGPVGASKEAPTEIALVDIKEVLPKGTDSVAITSIQGEVVIEFRIGDKSEIDRDAWVVNMQFVSEHKNGAQEEQGGSLGVGQRMKQFVQETNDRRKYWTQRQTDLMVRKQEAEERKKKFGTEGMKYTAVAMANRS